MPVRRIPSIGEIRIPKALAKEFSRDIRVIIKTHPAGLWPIDTAMLTSAQFVKALQGEVGKTYDLVLVPKK